jgi:hypothetical protein
MKSKTKKRTWFDVQIVILTVAMTAVLSLWNLFAGPDREVALASQEDELADNPVPIENSSPTPVVAALVPESGEKIMLGGKEPQTTIVVQKSRGKSTTSTRSS